MAEEAIDVLMHVIKSKQPLPAESTTRFSQDAANLSTAVIDRTMRLGFRTGFFCELREFSFSAGIVPKRSEDKRSETEKEKQRLASLEKEKKFASLQGKDKLQESRERVREKQTKAILERKGRDFVDMQPVEFTRLMDSMSTNLFSALVGCDTLDRLSVVKRKAAGSKSSGEVYLRLDFENVLLTNLDWKDSDHLILETGIFIYRKVNIRYRAQQPDGSLGPIIQSDWEMKSVPMKKG